jgi:hypothetical protein
MMKKTSLHTASLIGLFAMAGCQTTDPSAESQASGHGAVAYSSASRDWGLRWNVTSRARAAQLAMKDCAAASCQIVLEFGPRQCGTLALGPSRYGVGVGPTAAAAEKAALAQCSVGGQQCRVAPAECNS